MYQRPTTLSELGVKFLGTWEGLVLRPYDDAMGYATIGYGHLLHESRVTPSDLAKYRHFTKVEALALLRSDAAWASKGVHDHVKAKINQQQHDALTSFVFNVGVGDRNSGFVGSTLLKVINKHPGTDKGIVGHEAFSQIHTELLKWVNGGTAAEKGLIRRRNAEYYLFETGRYK